MPPIRNYFLSCLILLLITPALADDHEGIIVEGVFFPANYNTLQLQGQGLLRVGLVIKAYVAAYYQAQPGASHEDPTSGRRLEIEYFHSIAAEDFVQATQAGIAANTSADDQQQLSTSLPAFLDLYQAVEPGDRYSLTWIPQQGLELALNGQPLGQLNDALLASALFSIWLGEEPASESLKEDLLNR
ncbi:chalcone isomerase family protein [Marinospirillum perlucidum]|uniref:chalcone isomerase family protein n=1 Tax=Marinospirillum perlucidum TaxID=1982602 RepID=UPI000DF39A0F|nr:chalcone isomerase family protein [Marinospirillum perlucidum]